MSQISFDAETIRHLAAILEQHGLTELELRSDAARIRLVRAPASNMALASPVQAAVPIAAPPVATPAQPAATAAEPPPPTGAVKSPMVGIAYLAPEPGAPPYVVLGQAVAAGQTLLLIEAMKTFNQIKAPRAGTVTQILIQPGAPVEYDQPLIVLT